MYVTDTIHLTYPKIKFLAYIEPFSTYELGPNDALLHIKGGEASRYYALHYMQLV